MSSTSADQTQTKTIWSELDQWAQGLQPWQRFILSEAVRNSRVSDEKIREAYGQFLFDSDLDSAPSSPIDVPTNITGRPSTAAHVDIRLSAISELQAVNALPIGATLTFGDELTVVYGANGVGKSGFTRVLANACFSRSRYDILPNIYAKEPSPPLAATIKIADKAGGERSYVFDGKTEFPELKRIAIFDTIVARTHIAVRKSLGFSPTGFDIFPEMVRVYGVLTEQLDAAIERHPIENPFYNSFIKPESSISNLIASLGVDTDLEFLSRLAVFSHTEEERLAEVQRQKESLQSQSVKETLLQLEGARTDVRSTIEKLDVAYRAMGEERLSSFRRLVGDYLSKAQVVANHGIESFKHESLRAVGCSEWEAMIQAAYILAAKEHTKYPHEGDHCVLCQQCLSPQAMTLLHRIWNFLGSDHRAQAEESARSIDNVITSLANLSLDFFEPETTAYVNVTRLSPGLAHKIANGIKRIKEHRGEVISTLSERKDAIPSLSIENVIPDLLALQDQVDVDIDRLRKLDVQSAIAILENERILLRHRQLLCQIYPDVRSFVLGRRWVQKAKAAKTLLSPRILTNKETELFSIVIAENYKETLSRECSALACNMPIVFRTQGQKGQTLKSLLVMDEHNPEVILSEGEQKAVALADFLTEVSLNSANAGIVLDDPVTSLDHQRKELIAQRLVEEARKRQVVVFTHDLVFLSLLTSGAEKENISLTTHWIHRDSSGSPGQVALEDSPASSKKDLSTEKARRFLDLARRAKGSDRVNHIQSGMHCLRRVVEEIIPVSLFKGVVKRWQDSITVGKLREINWLPDLVEDIVDVYGRTSAYNQGHSISDERVGAPYEVGELEALIEIVDGLISKARPARKP